MRSRTTILMKTCMSMRHAPGNADVVDKMRKRSTTDRRDGGVAGPVY